eukprot:751804-Pyramimonas_sp.AAC.1
MCSRRRAGPLPSSPPIPFPEIRLSARPAAEPGVGIPDHVVGGLPVLDLHCERVTLSYGFRAVVGAV